MKDQNIFSKVINLKIPITFSLHNVWILLGQEIWEGGALQWQCMVLGFLWNKFREYLQIILGNTLHIDNTRCRVIFQYHYSDTKQ